MKFEKLLDKRLLVVLLLLFSGVALLLNIRSRQEIRRQAALPAPNVSLQVGTTTTNPVAGETFPVDVTMTFVGTNISGSRDVYGVDLKFIFNQAKLEVVSITRGTGLGDGCTVGSTTPVVLAPVVSETDCNFKDTETGGVIPTANSSGVLEFGVVPFDWNAASGATYQPTPLNLSGASGAKSVATVTFRVKTGATGTANVMLVGTGGTSTVDTNVAGISSVANGSEVGDVLASINPAAGINVIIGGTDVTPTVTTAPDICTNPSTSPRHSQGDTDCDGDVDAIDLGNVILNYNGANGAPLKDTNFDNDTDTDAIDLGTLIINYNT